MQIQKAFCAQVTRAREAASHVGDNSATIHKVCNLNELGRNRVGRDLQTAVCSPLPVLLVCRTCDTFVL